MKKILQYMKYLHFFLIIGKKSNEEKDTTFNPAKVKTRIDTIFPYSSKTGRKKNRKSHAVTKSPKIIYPQGDLYFEFERKIRYNQNREKISMEIQKSFTIPIENIFTQSSNEKNPFVIGRKNKTVLIINPMKI